MLRLSSLSTCQLRAKDSNVLGDGEIMREKEAGFPDHQVEGKPDTAQQTGQEGGIHFYCVKSQRFRLAIFTAFRSP